MFQTVSNDFVKSVCGSGEGLSSIESVLPAGSINEASKVSLGTFAIKTKRQHFWQSTSCKLLMGCEASVDKSQVANESVLLNDFDKEIDLTEKNTFNLTALKQIGVSVEIDYNYNLSANLGPIHRQDLNKEAIKDYSVPAGIVSRLGKQNSRRVLAMVTSLFTVPNECSLTLTKQLQIQDQISLAKLSDNEKDGNVWKRERVNTMKMVAGQVIAYEIQECTLDIQTGKFSFPVDGEKGKVIDAHAVKVDGSSQDHTDATGSGGGDNPDSVDAIATFVMVPPSSELQDETIDDLIEHISNLRPPLHDQLTKLLKAVFTNSTQTEIRSFVFELEDNFDKLAPSKSVKDFDCDNGELLALMDFILKDGNYSANILFYIYFLFQLAQELPLNLLSDVSQLTDDQLSLSKEALIVSSKKCAQLDQKDVLIEEKVQQAAKEVWTDLFVMKGNVNNAADRSEVKTYGIKDANLNSAQFYVFDKFIRLFPI